ncbi:YczE/YyaS/YitT family protein [Nocardia wallacei]|uniref:YczE/YyaS/YitT family protein n=1 Tax=Nocardia wallacei TaxID=480035 RepID=UPI0024548B93|nr:hypothetical protein [Nocardia wallacei]
MFTLLRGTADGTFRNYPVVLGKYLSGAILFSLGAYFFIASHMGTDPLDTFALGLRRHIPVTVGIAQFGVALVCVLVVTGWARRRPPVSSLVTFFLCGSVIDLLLWSDWERSLPSGYGMLVVATLLCAYGSALIIMSGLGIRAMDLVAIQALRTTGLPFWIGKGLIEGVLLLSGYLLGGPVGVGTVFFLVGVDLLIQPMMLLNRRILGLANQGMPVEIRRPAEAMA